MEALRRPKPTPPPILEGKEADDDEEEEYEEEGCGGEFGVNVKKMKLVFGGGGSQKKGSGGGGGGGGAVSPPLCQAETCSADLTEAKRYHRRHKVCELHSKASVVIVAGLRQRFCQQCSRFHELFEFDDTKRSCRSRLAGHNERRRKTSSESQGVGSAHPSLGLQLNENHHRRQAGDRGRTLLVLPGNPAYKQLQIP